MLCEYRGLFPITTHKDCKLEPAPEDISLACGGQAPKGSAINSGYTITYFKPKWVQNTNLNLILPDKNTLTRKICSVSSTG
jgi:hypothetical protein